MFWTIVAIIVSAILAFAAGMVIGIWTFIGMFYTGHITKAEEISDDETDLTISWYDQKKIFKENSFIVLCTPEKHSL